MDSVKNENIPQEFSSKSGLIPMFLRSLHLFAIFLPTMLSSPLALVRRCRFFWFRIFVRALERSGATFIKLGQIASSRPDMLPQDLCHSLRKLQDNAPAHSDRKNREIIRQAFGKAITDVFSALPEMPIASGSIAQVYKATLVDGREVAVKVRHPGLQRTIALDVALIEFLARLADKIPSMHWLNLEESAREFGTTIRNQLDLSVEARNLHRFRANFADEPAIVFPCPIDEWVCPNILVETFEAADPIKHILTTDHPAKPVLARQGLKALMKMIFVDGYIHADMHPGNILVQIDDQGAPHTVLLDTGMTAELKDKDRENFQAFFSALVKFDGQLAAQLMIENAPAHDCRNPQAFADALDKVFAEVRDLPLAEIEIAAVISKVMFLVRRHRIKIESAFTSVNVAIMVVEGLGRQLDPKLNLLLEASPWLALALNQPRKEASAG